MLAPLEIVRSADFNRNHDRTLCRIGKGRPCVICGRAVVAPKSMVRVGLGGGHLMDKDDYRKGDLGFCPVGSDCLRRNPAVAPYVVTVEESNRPDQGE